MKTIRLSLAALALTFCSLGALAQNTAPTLTAYYDVKDALVATDAVRAKAGATKLVAALAKIDAAKLSTTDKKALAMAKTKATAITKTTDVDVQREQFDGLSTSMIALAKATKPAAKAYVQFCPMAAEGKGASWLSDKKEVRNPYYGDKMLKCGSVKEEI
ncbi:hypothetical protein FAES_pFAES01099 (plasmid) [Fibrella aestuarina BUZ 2]|uniref:DUF3347 domain-containing protein n=1 Tax=Fibrella aestuarina BUZ 2 TaxID=1166018 RepID=I0KHI8_9BACT|nr:DUF3347 domain-containing protein [Fibrella aestuarina]CCH03591.1 hypothetical protein FAES_pFAES01099 [Fibrella aestuarina BUZ 2]